MTTPRDAIGLSDRLRRGGRMLSVGPDIANEAATQLDALSARVSALQQNDDAMAAQIKTLVGQKTEWMDRATRAEQERDKAVERLKPLSEVVLPWGNVGSGMVSADAVLAARDLVRRLASGPDKEKRE